MNRKMSLVEINNLSVAFQTAGGLFTAVDRVSLHIDPGEVVSIVGESGSGKSVAMLALMGLLPWTARVTADSLVFDGKDLLTIGKAEKRRIIGKEITIIFQEPMTSLNPCFDLQQRLQLAYLFISHDLSVVRHIADEVMVMYLGRPIEFGSRDDVFSSPLHPYTRALLSATPVADPFRVKERIMLKDELPSPIDLPPGCTFHPRCPDVMVVCNTCVPELRSIGQRIVACHAVQENR